MSFGSEQYMLKKLLSAIKLAATKKIQMISQKGVCSWAILCYSSILLFLFKYVLYSLCHTHLLCCKFEWDNVVTKLASLGVQLQSR